MEITWLGHSCFRLRHEDMVVVTDPFSNSLGLSMGPVEALAVTVSHDHPNHSYVSGVLGNPRIIRGPGEYELRDIYITGFFTPPREGDPPSYRNTAYLGEMGNLRICHLGDIARPLDTALLAELGSTDILLVPAGEGCTLSASQVTDLVHALSPRIVIPMHYHIPGITAQVGPLEPFLREMGIREAVPQARLVITRSSLPQETRIVLLEAQGRASPAPTRHNPGSAARPGAR